MSSQKDYLPPDSDHVVASILKGIDRDVERGEDVLMLAFALVMLSSTFAPVAKPIILLPLIALTFALSAGYARINYHNMERKLQKSMARLNAPDKDLLHPVARVFVEHKMCSLAEAFNPLKNLRRLWKSGLGGLLMNPLWMPIFYVLGMQIDEEKNLSVLNRAICGVEQKIAALSTHQQDIANQQENLK